MNNSNVLKLTALGAVVVVVLAAMSLFGASAAAVGLCLVLGAGFLWLLAIAIGANPKVSVSGATFDASRGEGGKSSA